MSCHWSKRLNYKISRKILKEHLPTVTATDTNPTIHSNISPVSTLYLLLPPQNRRGERGSRKTGQRLSLKKSILRQGHSSDIKRHPTILRDKPATHASLSSQQELRLGRRALDLVSDLLCSRGAGILQACPPSLHGGLNPPS